MKISTLIIGAAAVSFASFTGAAAEQPDDPSGYGQARAADAQSVPGFVGSAISERASTKFGGTGKTEGDKSQEDLVAYSGNENGVRSSD
ncbi:hypothetical protein [Alkalilacustris brevis]|uniref:hypothetical protein n=1 Tax=Alkalilacustris brevis TaxID=2026338 RepID=UPI000E0CC058|nr:hypothetical protein [Alkalilacustris brevis]